MGIDVGRSVLLDTNCFIYFFEDNPDYSGKLEKVFIDIQDGKTPALMSVVSFMEVLVKPKRDKNIFIENRYKLMLSNFPNLSIVNVDYKIADIASRLRAYYNIKTPDALIIATGITMKADCFITNDSRLEKVCREEGIQVIIIENIDL
ncbi:PIN domain-containing protein [Sedimentibacter hydroxybenzoicus DSM 7310]|uniref:PIN domain-containing protein n=1 Tax=Sedimentibacter hydroxybenzoicus DSM 7310 TaxID=1123245 RepID=A0A974BK91_SEDHY|nr:PIN domain-containing protein [Sedimentibacter hydroxybenzoicus]NYB74195.1 PIN domain-containing protein [Sedimentibacter hydroxybenzoicus DSM 7310]